jgi:hypothetical protein
MGLVSVRDVFASGGANRLREERTTRQLKYFWASFLLRGGFSTESI